MKYHFPQCKISQIAPMSEVCGHTHMAHGTWHIRRIYLSPLCVLYKCELGVLGQSVLWYAYGSYAARKSIHSTCIQIYGHSLNGVVLSVCAKSSAKRWWLLLNEDNNIETDTSPHITMVLECIKQICKNINAVFLPQRHTKNGRIQRSIQFVREQNKMRQPTKNRVE